MLADQQIDSAGRTYSFGVGEADFVSSQWFLEFFVLNVIKAPSI